MLKKMNDKLIEMYVKAQCKAHDFLTKEDGDVNIVSIVVIIGIVILLAILFRGQIEKLLNTLFETIEKNAKGVITN